MAHFSFIRVNTPCESPILSSKRLNRKSLPSWQSMTLTRQCHAWWWWGCQCGQTGPAAPWGALVCTGHSAYLLMPALFLSCVRQWASQKVTTQFLKILQSLVKERDMQIMKTWWYSCSEASEAKFRGCWSGRVLRRNKLSRIPKDGPIFQVKRTRKGPGGRGVADHIKAHQSQGHRVAATQRAWALKTQK